MKIHEYQAKEILRRFGVPTLKGQATRSVDEAIEIARGFGNFPVVIKAQIHAGGRGKGGGVKLAQSLDEVKRHSDAILGMQLVTHQTGPEGQKVRRLFVEEGAEIDRELYAGFVLDRATDRITLMVSAEGGMDIEEVAEKNPEKIHKAVIDPTTGLMPSQVRRVSFAMGLDSQLTKKMVKLCISLYNAFLETDASILEINPLVVTKQGDLLVLDAKMNFDDNALFRHPDIEEYRDLDEEDSKETEAKKYDLSYIALSGNVGCMVNGAGLAMGTMDIIKHCGGEPANFLDVGGGANAEKVSAAFRIILGDPAVKAVLVNIFGGIMKCDVIAEGVIQAAKQMDLKIPVVVRLEGTNVELGKKMLNESSLDLVSADSMLDAAQKVVKLAAEGRA